MTAGAVPAKNLEQSMSQQLRRALTVIVASCIATTATFAQSSAEPLPAKGSIQPEDPLEVERSSIPSPPDEDTEPPQRLLGRGTATVNPKTGRWTFRYTNSAVGIERTVGFTPGNRTAVRIRSSLRRVDGEYVYQYVVSNGASAEQTINLFVINTPVTLIAPLGPFDESQRATQEEYEAAWYAHFLKNDARLKQARKEQQARVSQPPGWRGRMMLHDDSTVYGWFPGLSDDAPGIPPGTAEGRFEIRMPHLPGAFLADVAGRSEDKYLPDDLPIDGELKDSYEELRLTREQWVPVIGPAIAVPAPFDGAELVRRLRVHTQGWLPTGLVTAATLDKLQQGLTAIEKSLVGGDRTAATTSVQNLLTEGFACHQGMTHRQVEVDLEAFAPGDVTPKLPIARKLTKEKLPSHACIDRVAVRALTFNLMFLVTQLYRR